MTLINDCLNILRYTAVLLLACFSQASCSDSNSVSRCSLTSDSVSITSSLSVEEKTYYLVYRISGWHEKIESFELYGTEPSFDNCGESTIAPLFGESIDDKDSNNNDQYVAHIYFATPNRFVFDYAPGTPPKPDYHKSLILEQKNTQ